jgi:hypothetical protein
MVIISQNSIHGHAKCNMGQGVGENDRNQMALQNAIWANFVIRTRVQNKTTQYSVQGTYNGPKNNTKHT